MRVSDPGTQERHFRDNPSMLGKDKMHQTSEEQYGASRSPRGPSLARASRPSIDRAAASPPSTPQFLLRLHQPRHAEAPERLVRPRSFTVQQLSERPLDPLVHGDELCLLAGHLGQRGRVHQRLGPDGRARPSAPPVKTRPWCVVLRHACSPCGRVAPRVPWERPVVACPCGTQRGRGGGLGGPRYGY